MQRVDVTSLALAAGLLAALALPLAAGPTETSTCTDSTWLRGSVDERFALVGKHLRGFDMAMVETDYRYGELYWAGRDRNWLYARYQLRKLRTALENGIERRPKRAASARAFATALRPLEEAIERKDQGLFLARFPALTAACNTCHRAEQMSFFTIAAPRVRRSHVERAPDQDPGGK